MIGSKRGDEEKREMRDAESKSNGWLSRVVARTAQVNCGDVDGW
jgi:hypothetical protein